MRLGGSGGSEWDFLKVRDLRSQVWLDGSPDETRRGRLSLVLCKAANNQRKKRGNYNSRAMDETLSSPGAEGAQDGKLYTKLSNRRWRIGTKSEEKVVASLRLPG